MHVIKLSFSVGRSGPNWLVFSGNRWVPADQIIGPQKEDNVKKKVAQNARKIFSKSAKCLKRNLAVNLKRWRVLRTLVIPVKIKI